MSFAIFVVQMFDAIRAQGSVVNGNMTSAQIFGTDLEKLFQVQLREPDSRVVGRLDIDKERWLAVEIFRESF
jgi:hypothetical protein